MIKQGPLHRIYATSFANQNFNPSLALIVLSGTRPWDFFWDIFFFIGHCEVAQEVGSKFVSLNSPFVQFDTTLTQRHMTY